MGEMSRRFNFDDFDAQIAEALAEHGSSREDLDRQMAEEAEAWEMYERWLEHDTGKRPGEIGGVVVQLSFRDQLSDHPRLFDPDDAA